MKVVVNKCYGGFSLSPKAIHRMAELQGRPCYLYKHDFATKQHIPLSLERASKGRMLFFSAYDVPNIDEVLPAVDWHSLSQEERAANNKAWKDHSLDIRPGNRSDALLIQVVEELGVEANGGCAQLEIVEIPDGVQYEIDEYDGIESIHEVHRSW
jgi:hypothetical protein